MSRTMATMGRPTQPDACAASDVQWFDGVPLDGPAVARALEQAAPRVCARWKPTILFHLALAPHRRCELDRCLQPFAVSPKVLTDQLRGLEDDGIVVRIDRRAAGLSDKRHVTYILSPLGQELVPLIGAFTRWSLRATAESTEVRPARRQTSDADRPAAYHAVCAADTPRVEERAWPLHRHQTGDGDVREVR